MLLMCLIPPSPSLDFSVFECVTATIRKQIFRLVRLLIKPLCIIAFKLMVRYLIKPMLTKKSVLDLNFYPLSFINIYFYPIDNWLCYFWHSDGKIKHANIISLVSFLSATNNARGGGGGEKTTTFLRSFAQSTIKVIIIWK